jgi:hypothetical protein
MTQCHLRISRRDYDLLFLHLFPGDQDEHGAVLLAGMSQPGKELTLHIREVHLAAEKIDYVEGKIGYRALTTDFIHRLIIRARDERLVYLAVHNHASDQHVQFSSIDLESHRRGYPALLQISHGMPVGALVFGRRSVQADIWLPNGKRLDLFEMVVVGNSIRSITPRPRRNMANENVESFERQIRMFGKSGQERLRACRVGIIGLGGSGSIITEFLVRLGIERFCLVDPDRIDESNLSRVVGAEHSDVLKKIPKVEIAKRHIYSFNKKADVTAVFDDFAKESVAKQFVSCDYLFLAADSMRARLVFNAIVHQYLIPGVQIGSKIRANVAGDLLDVMSVNRPVRPGVGCLWCNQLIDPSQLAKEAKTDAERIVQNYGVEEPNPSVISLNGISAAHSVNDFLLNYLSLRPESEALFYEYFHCLTGKRDLVSPRQDESCSECSQTGLRYGRGDLVELPCTEG